ncbi:MAG: methyltransferase [Pseudomonadales bacterium]
MSSELARRFLVVDELLSGHRTWWQFRPFHHVESIWRDREPALHHALSALRDDDVAVLQQNPEQLATFLAKWIPTKALRDAALLPRWPTSAKVTDARLSHAIPGRKWAQIQAFAAHVPGSQHILEWCAGKGHLGRVLAARAKSVTSLEWQPDLCVQGGALARRAQVEMDFSAVDVLSPAASEWVQSQSHAVALHACGQLHTRLLSHVVNNEAAGVTLSPCCYYLIDEEFYRPMSVLCGNSSLRLDKQDLHVPLRETVTGGARVRRMRRKEVSWRLAFDSLQRYLNNSQYYMPVPNVPKSLLSGDFSAFSAWAAEKKGLSIPQDLCLDQFEQAGAQRYHEVIRMELVQLLFQRPLEIWLVLDRAMYLQENGYKVELGEFCARELTPRNILLCASREA